jgi:type II secretory pathway component PulF
MPTFQYRALTPVGEVVTGSLDASSLAEVNRRVEYLGLIPIEAATARNESKFGSSALSSVLPSLTRRARRMSPFSLATWLCSCTQGLV